MTRQRRRSGNQGTPQQNPRAQRQRRVALDSTATQYWNEYFGDYGKQLTKNVQKRIAAALWNSMGRRLAAKGQSVELVEYAVAPQGAPSLAKNARGQVTEIKVEGVFRGVVASGKRRMTARRIFCATFTPKGEMVGLESVAV
jgi:hypothetical protein